MIRKTPLFLSACLFCFGGSLFGVEIGAVVFRENFDAPDALAQWTSGASQAVSLVSCRRPVDETDLKNAPKKESTVLQIVLPREGKALHASITRKIPLETLYDTRLRVEAFVKAEDVQPPPNSWNGIKLMLILETPGGKKWLQKNLPGGSFDWRRVRFNAVVPREATGATLLLGLENTKGTVLFDEVAVTVTGKKRPPSERGDAPKTVYKGHDRKRLRGAMISPDRFGPEDIRVLAGEWKANHVRWQMTWAGFPNGPADTADVGEYNAWIEQQCQLLDRMLPECEKYGVLVLLDLHTPPGGRDPRDEGSEMRLFRDKKWQDAFVAVWEKLARRYKDAKAVWGYDLLNEPVEGDIPDDRDILDWRALAMKTAKAIRAIDPERAIILEAAPWGGPDALEWFEPFEEKEVPHVVYSVHMYNPGAFTHQGVYDKTEGIAYPGTIAGEHWDKEKLRRALRVPIDYARDYGVHIYVGEFSAIRWAPEGSACRYLKDCIEIFEEEGWDWAYHAFREWDGWSVEHGAVKSDRKPSPTPTDRRQLLQHWFDRN